MSSATQLPGDGLGSPSLWPGYFCFVFMSAFRLCVYVINVECSHLCVLSGEL